MANLNRNMQNFPQRGRGLGHVTPKIFGIRSNISPKLLELETSNLVNRFICGKPSGRSNNIFQRGVAYIPQATTYPCYHLSPCATHQKQQTLSEQEAKLSLGQPTVLPKIVRVTCSALPIQSRVSNLKSLAQVVLKICSIVCEKL